MVADTIHISSSSPVHPSFHLLGQKIVLDIPIHVFLLGAVGGLFLLRHVYSLLRLLLELTIIPGIDVKSFQSRSGETWAVVTGATSGIGLEFARQLGSKKYNVVLIGRRQEALEGVAKGIESEFRVKTRCLTLDLASPQSRSTAFPEIEKLAAEHDVGVLINNAAASHEIPVSFAETPSDEIESILQTNMLGTIHLTRRILPSMIARSNRERAPKSLILNIGSMDGRIPPSLLATYGATKGGLSTFTKAVAEEVKLQGVIVRLVLPAFVVSNMSKIRRPSLTVPSAKAFVASTLASIDLPRGSQGRAYEMTPFWAHALMDYAVSIGGYATEAIGMKVVDYLHKDIRARALRKKMRGKKGE